MGKLIKGVKDVVNNYELFVFDIWGVIHNGISAYPYAVETLKFLKQQNKMVCFLSNSPSTTCKVEKVLDKFGISKDLYTLIYTAGESFIKSFHSNYEYSKRNRWFILDNNNVSNIEEVLLSANVHIVQDLKEADNVIVASVDEHDFFLKRYKEFILTCILKNITVYSMNADSHVISENGPLMRPALLMHALDAVGVKTIVHGKPNPEIFKELFDLLPPIPPQKTVMIGDSITTDINGAKFANIDSLLTYQPYPMEYSVFHFSEGILNSFSDTKHLTEENLLRLVKHTGTRPTYYIPQLRV